MAVDLYPDSNTGVLLSTCWCGHGYVHVTREELHAGRTHRCTRRGCRAPAGTR